LIWFSPIDEERDKKQGDWDDFWGVDHGQIFRHWEHLLFLCTLQGGQFWVKPWLCIVEILCVVLQWGDPISWGDVTQESNHVAFVEEGLTVRNNESLEVPLLCSWWLSPGVGRVLVGCQTSG